MINCDFVTILERLIGKPARWKDAPLPPTEMIVTFADTSKAQRMLGYSPRVSVEEGLDRFWNWYKAGVLQYVHAEKPPQNRVAALASADICFQPGHLRNSGLHQPPCQHYRLPSRADLSSRLRFADHFEQLADALAGRQTEFRHQVVSGNERCWSNILR